MKRRCWAKDTYEKLTPYLQVIGYIIMLGTLLGALYTILGFIWRSEEDHQRLNNMEEQTSKIPVMAREIDDLHDFLLGNKWANK